MTNLEEANLQPHSGSHRYALCVRNDGYQASLEVRKIYVIAPAEAGDTGMIRVLDESGEDYLYPPDLFIAVDLPMSAEQAFAATPQ